MLWRCWLGGRKGIRPVKNFKWCSTGMVICLERDADLHLAQLMPLPLTVSCFNKIQIGFTFLVPAHPGSPRKRAVKRVCVCVCGIWCIKAWYFLCYLYLLHSTVCVMFNFAQKWYKGMFCLLWGHVLFDCPYWLVWYFLSFDDDVLCSLFS